MKKILIVGLSIIGLFLLLGAGRKFYLYDYEEVCVGYQQNVTAKIKYCYDVMKLTPTGKGNTGKDIGNILERAFNEVMEGTLKNERGELLNKLKEWLE